MVNDSQDDSDSYSPSSSSDDSSSETSSASSTSNSCSNSDKSLQRSASQEEKVKTSFLVSVIKPELQKLAQEHVDTILDLHQKFPPLHKPGDKESKVPATQDTLDYFFRAFMLKREKFHSVLSCSIIPPVVKAIPFALSYQSFVLSYWPGPLQCCHKTFGSTRFFCKHLYDTHLPPNDPPNLSCSAMGAQATSTPSSNLPVKLTTPEQPAPTQSNFTPVERGKDAEGTGSTLSVAPEAHDSPMKELSQAKVPATSTGKSIKDYFDKRGEQVSHKKETKSPGNVNPRQSASSTGAESSLPASRRRPLSPSAKPSPLRVKMQRMSNGSSPNSLDKSASKNRDLTSLSGRYGRLLSDTSTDGGEDTELNTSGTASRTRVRPKRACTTVAKRDAHDPLLELGLTQLQLDELFEEQQRFEPQHEPGKPEGFLASPSRIAYFMQVLKLKLGKYGLLTTQRPRSPSRHIPLALPLLGFVRYYWPGKLMCCNKVLDSCASLEAHINRQHKPPKPFPEFSPLSDAEGDNDDDGKSDSDATDRVLPAIDYPGSEKHSMEVAIPTRNASSADKKSKYPPGFMDHQNIYLPQHKMGDPEDFLANKESISYFLEVFTLKVEKYAHVTASRKKPLGGSFGFFSQLYWPGMVNCCGALCDSVDTFSHHIVKFHAPPSRTPPALSVLSSPPKKRPPEPTRSTPRKSPAARLNPSPSASTSKALAVRIDEEKPEACTTPMRQLRTIEEEIRQLRRQMSDATSLKTVRQLLVLVLQSAVSLSEKMKSITLDRSDRCMFAECLESAWMVSKSGIVRWRELKEPHDPFLDAVQYVYTTAPVFINWDSQDHMAVVENIVRLTFTAVQHVLSTQSQKREASPALSTKSDSNATTKHRVPRVQLTDNISKVVETAPKLDAESSHSDKRGSHMSIQEFCHRVNVALLQNTKARRDTGFKDDSGFYHPIYRYSSIALMIKLYAPPQMTSLRCCGRIFTLQGLRTHVAKMHEAADSKSAISLAPV